MPTCRRRGFAECAVVINPLFQEAEQISDKGKAQLGWASRDGKHLNVSLDGKNTHK
ncbi:polymorphic toxin type 17 domain-containing protein [Cedecea neteri]|uniref:polymorphic toxin type 17 domain-containing protein n=1 Tax=Cedecea neteri TaxID=158822 RepID=UPI0039E2330A